MRVIFIFLLALVTTAQAQQINPVPDYIFRNQMSVGRNAATDTAAYMSVGPRYGANKGIMPPMVTDTNSVTGVKRNGLLIFSLQLNNFAYWDSTTARFRKITAEASVDSLLFATRAWRQKGDDSLGAIIAVKTDTGLISTKAYRQKGIDSVVTLISTLGGGTVLAVSAGTGMNFSTITTSGAVNADTLILSTKAWRQKGDDSLGAIIGTKVNISDTAAMLGAYLRKADTTAMLTPYLRKVDTTEMLTPYVRAAGFGLVKGTQLLSSDTAAMATRARVQKGIDSVAGLFTSPDTLTLSTRAWRQKGDDSLGAIIGTKATATGTTNYLSKFTGTSALGNSIVYATTSEVGISTPSPTHTLDVNGRTRVRTIDSTGTGMNMLYSDADGVIKKAAIPAGGSGTVTSITAGTGLTGGTITTTGTIAVDTLNISTKAWRQKGIDSVSQNLGLYLPLTGGTLTGGLTGTTGAFTSSGSGNTFSVNHSSGAGIAVNIEKGGNGEGLYVNKTSGTGNAATIIGTLNATTLVKSGGTSSQYLMADGSTSTLTNPVTGTGTTNYVPKWSGTSTQTISQIFDNGTNVGIGTASPSYKLDVNGALRGGGAILESNSPFLTGSNLYASSNFALGTLTANVLSFFTNNNERFRITSSGDVAIGNTSPAYKLDITGTLRNTTGAAFATSSGNVLVGTTVDGGAFKLDVVGGDARINTIRVGRGAGTVTTNNTAVGLSALNSNTTGANITAVGSNSLNANTTGNSHTAVGYNALVKNTTGAENTAIGLGAMGFTTTSSFNVAVGVNALAFDTTGGNNTALGYDAGRRINSGGDGSNADNSIFIGRDSRASEYNNTNEIVIATNGRGNGSNTTTIGNSSTTTTFLLGKLDVGSFDSTATGMNMLYADANGVIKKAAVPSGGSGTVTSITAGTGLTGGTITTSGTIAVDTASIATRARVQKGIDSVTTLANTKLSGTGLSGYFPKWTGTSTQDTSQLFQLGRNIGIGTATPTFLLHLPDANTTNQAMIAGTVFGSDGNGQTIKPSNSEAMTIYGQSDAGYLYGAIISSVGRWGVNTTSVSDAVLSVDGNVKIVTIDSTATARNMLYQDANGVIKKSAVPSGLSMADDVMTASGSWVATKDAGSGVTINNVAYTTNGTTKMVTVDGSFYIPETSWTNSTWIEVGTIPSGFRPSKTINWNNDFIVSGAEYERADNTDFTGALEWTYAQMRVKDTGVVEVIGDIQGSNTIAAGGTAYIIVQFTQSYIIK